MLSSVFSYSVKCYNNVSKLVDAVKQDDYDSIESLSKEFRNDALSGTTKIVTRYIAGDILDSLLKGEVGTAVGTLCTEVLNSKVHIATVAINSIAAMVTNTMLVQERIRRRPDLLSCANDSNLSREERIAAARALVA